MFSHVSESNWHVNVAAKAIVVNGWCYQETDMREKFVETYTHTYIHHNDGWRTKFSNIEHREQVIYITVQFKTKTKSYDLTEWYKSAKSQDYIFS